MSDRVNRHLVANRTMTIGPETQGQRPKQSCLTDLSVVDIPMTDVGRMRVVSDAAAIGALESADAGLPFDAMYFPLGNTTDTSDAVVCVDQEKPHQPRWPIFVIAFAGVVTLLWISWLFWLLSRILFFVFYDYSQEYRFLFTTPIGVSAFPLCLGDRG